MPFFNGIGPAELVIIGILGLPLVLLAVVALAIMRRDRGAWVPPDDPRAVLAERLARNEITPEEFDVAMRALGYGDPES
jgi:uncharacterized membrane protein